MFTYFSQVDEPASGGQDDASVSQESPSVAGDSTKLVGGEDYWSELTEALRRRGAVNEDAHVSSALKERDHFWHYLEKEWKAISARIEREEAKPRPFRRQRSVSYALSPSPLTAPFPSP